MYGYCICDTASYEVFEEAAEFIINEMGYVPSGDALRDVDDSAWRTFKKGSSDLTLVCDAQIDYIAIISDSKLSIKCLHEFTPID